MLFSLDLKTFRLPNVDLLLKYAIQKSSCDIYLMQLEAFCTNKCAKRLLSHYRLEGFIVVSFKFLSVLPYNV